MEEKNKNISSKFESKLILIAFLSLLLQIILFFVFRESNDGVSSFGDFFGFSAAFLSALVIVLLIKELKEQRESRVKLEKSFDDNANTLKAVKEFFESQSDYQSEQVNHLKSQNIDMLVKRINRKYQNDIENILFFKSKFIEAKVRHRNNSSLTNIITLINEKLANNPDNIVSLFDVYNLAYFRLEPFMNTLLNMLNKVEIDILTYSTSYSSLLELSGKELNELTVNEEATTLLKALANILISLNSILSTEEKLIFGIYLGIYGRVYSDRKFSLSLLIYDEIYFETENRLKVRRLLASHLPESMDAINLIRRLNSNEK
ncbi:MAG: hypothetical protein CVV25_03610 [Ignavibacteriae bacterium HGW-Ignavibacteriae-4]|jgi:hypothetical protein|nr:MAG: hypothetical protein CVV25_03610 [Ignavibacteriae bacterium HGW-Ignavibacteriae-4]